MKLLTLSNTFTYTQTAKLDHKLWKLSLEMSPIWCWQFQHSFFHYHLLKQHTKVLEQVHVYFKFNCLLVRWPLSSDGTFPLFLGLLRNSVRLHSYIGINFYYNIPLNSEPVYFFLSGAIRKECFVYSFKGGVLTLYLMHGSEVRNVIVSRPSWNWKLSQYILR